MPKLLKTPFAIDAAEGFRTDIQESTGAAPNSATYQVGFPPITMQSITSNGMPPKGSDLNGVLYDITDNLVFLTQGGGYGFDPAYATSIGGYPLNARLRLTNGDIVKSTIDGNTNNPNVDMVGWVNFEAAQKEINSTTNRAYSSVSELRSFEPSYDGEQVYLNGLSAGSVVGSGYWYYDATDTTSVDNGWFIVVTANGKRLKRVGLTDVIDLAWAGIADQGDLALKWQGAIDYADSVRVRNGHIFNCPIISIPHQRYTMSTGVLYPTYISTEFNGNTLIKVSFLRSACAYVVAMRNASGTQSVYRNESEGIRWNHTITCNSGKVKFVYNNTSVQAKDRPSCITSGNIAGTTNAYQCNMRVTNVEAYEFRAAHEVLGKNSWGYRFENCGFGGASKASDDDSTYSIWTSETINSDSGERNTYVNCFLSALRFDTPSMYTYFDRCSLDFADNDVMRFGASASYMDIRFTDCHIENFDGFVINSSLSFSDSTNVFVTFVGGRILPTGYTTPNTHDKVLFNGGCQVLLTGGFVLESSGYPSKNTLGEVLGRSGATVKISNMRTKDGRPWLHSPFTKMGVNNDFLSDTLGEVSPSTVLNNFIVSSRDKLQLFIDSSPETATKTLRIQANSTDAYVVLVANKFVRVEPNKQYLSRAVIELTDAASLGIPRPRIHWYDEDKTFLSYSAPTYDLSFTQYISGAGVPFIDRETRRIPNVHTAFVAPPNAAYMRQGLELINLTAGKNYYLHSITPHRSPLN